MVGAWVPDPNYVPPPPKVAKTPRAKASQKSLPKPRRTAPPNDAPPREIMVPLSPTAQAARQQIVTTARVDLWSTDVTVLRAALTQLAKLCDPTHSHAESARRACFETGVHLLTIKLLERHGATVQAPGLHLLWGLSMSSHRVIPDALVSMGAMEVAAKAVVVVVEKESSLANAAILVFAFRLLGDLVRRSGGWEAVRQHALVSAVVNGEAIGGGVEEEKKTEEEDGLSDFEPLNGVEDQMMELPHAHKSDETKQPPPEPTQSKVLIALQDIQEQYDEHAELQTVVACFLEQCVTAAGAEFLDLLVHNAPRCLTNLWRTGQRHGHAPVCAFFRQVADSLEKTSSCSV